MSDGELTESQAWADVLARLGQLGEEVVAEPFPDGERAHRGAIAHLLQQTWCWLGWSVFHADPTRPFFQRQNDLITQWGGPNADNIYRHARIADDRRYRITGKMNSCDEWLLAIRKGFMGQPVWGTVHECTATDFGIGPGDEFELLLGGEEQAGNWVPLPPGAVSASFREYYLDWRPADPAFFTIECLDPVLDPRDDRYADLSARLQDGISMVEHSIRNWNAYMIDKRAAGTDNVIDPPMINTGGLASARYVFCHWNLGPDDALVIETTVPDARYWSFQLYEMGTYELVDFLDRQSSLNQTQVAIDGDGLVRIVVSAKDPGVANWLDTGGRQFGQFNYRYFWSQGDPTYTSKVVPVDEVRSVLPADTVTATPEQRRATMAARLDHFAWRYRT